MKELICSHESALHFGDAENAGREIAGRETNGRSSRHAIAGREKLFLINYNLQRNVRNEITSISAKFGIDLVNTSEVTSRKTKWPCFLSHPVYNLI